MHLCFSPHADFACTAESFLRCAIGTGLDSKTEYRSVPFLELAVDGSWALSVLGSRWVRDNLPSKLGAVAKLCSKFLKC